MMMDAQKHAADERISLERLEKKILSTVTHKNLHSSSNQCQLNFEPLLPPQTITISPAQMEIISCHQNLLHKWKFLCKVSCCKLNTVSLQGVPKLFGKTAEVCDFLDFIQALGGLTCDASVVKPNFVKRVLASHACRYAVMFGDILSDIKCEEIIFELAKCDLSFVCAHGRPTITPLLDISKLDPIHPLNFKRGNNFFSGEQKRKSI